MSLTSPTVDSKIDRPLEGKTCLVTGSSRGIGRTIALEFANCGADVAVNYRQNSRAADEVAAAVEDAGEDAVVVQADVSDQAAVQRMADTVHEELGDLDVLVNNAGVTRDGKFENMSREDWDRVIDVNLGGTFNATKAFLDDVKRSECGRLINVSSVVGQEGNYGQANYAASKSALFGFTRTLALELAPHDSTANCVAPGFTETDMLEQVPDRVRDKIRERVPLDRFADPEDVVGIVRFLAGEESSYMTGQVLGVNGGMHW